MPTPEQHWAMRTVAWDIYTASLLGFKAHPGTSRDTHKPMTCEEIARTADEMLKERDKRFFLSGDQHD